MEKSFWGKMAVTTCIFDAYGTLFDVTAAAKIAATEDSTTNLLDNWPKLAQIWRAKQLEYSWIRAITGVHANFWEVTIDGLDFALEALKLDKNLPLRQRLLQLYNELQAFPEVTQMLWRLKQQGMNTAILSNGSPTMLQSAVETACIAENLDAVLSVEAVGIYKPHVSVYDLVGQQFSCNKEEVLFVSANGWDVSAATGYGFETVWVNRMDNPIDRLPFRPKHVRKDLFDIPNLAVKI